MNVTRRDEGQVLQVLGERVTVKLPSGRSPHGMSDAFGVRRVA